MRSIRAPTVVLPSYLQGSGPEIELAAKSYFIIELEKWITQYKDRLVKSRARYLARQTKVAA